MSELGERVALEAQALVGTPFRLQGRDPATGIDCIGLVALALQRARGSQVVPTPQDYRLRNRSVDHLLRFADRVGLQSANGPVRRGDIIHTSPGPAQDHLLIAAGPESFVHAHAGLRRVVQSTGTLADPFLHHWRPS